MQKEAPDWVVFVGRMQPVHNGHVHVLSEAKRQAKKGVIVFIGSVNGPRTPKNPFTFQQRAQLVTYSMLDLGFQPIPLFPEDKKFFVLPVKDYRYSNTAWIESIQSDVNSIVGKDDSVALIGFHKDDSSNYLNWFPQWKFLPVAVDESAETINATDIRDVLFENKSTGFLSGVLPSHSLSFINKFRTSAEFERLKVEHQKNVAYKKLWAGSPFPPMFVTVDAVVNCAGHILMVQRGPNDRGAGQWALPGGFLDQKERIVDGAIRELKEEADIDISERALKGLIRGNEVFDAPNRDMVGRCITHAFYFVVDTYKGKLPKVRAAGTEVGEIDDVMWVPIAELDEDNIYADHYDIIMHFLRMNK